MTRPLEPLTLRLSPPRNCTEGFHTGGPDPSMTRTPGGVWYRCRRCPHRWHVDHLGRLTGRKEGP